MLGISNSDATDAKKYQEVTLVTTLLVGNIPFDPFRSHVSCSFSHLASIM